MKRIISLLIAMSVIASLAACGSDVPETPDPSSTLADETTEAQEVKYDFGGRDYRILCRTDRSYEFDIAESTGDIVDDAVWERNMKVENEYNISIKPITADGTWSDRENFIGLITASVLANDDEYDLVAGYNGYITTLITQGCLTDMSRSNIDFRLRGGTPASTTTYQSAARCISALATPR